MKSKIKRLGRILLKVIGIAVLALIIAITVFWFRVSEIKLSDSVPEIDKEREARVLTAFFGIDNELPLFASFLYWKALGKDGMPLVFSQEVDPSSLDVTDFEIITENGTRFQAEHVTLMPANEEFELRTTLLIGEYGNHPENPPVSVKIVGDLMSRSGQNYKGQSVKVIPLPEGPVISYAEYFVIDDDYPYVEKGRGCDCPKEETSMVVRAVWSGGVRALNGKDLGDNELNSFRVTLVQGADTIKVRPYKLADLKDNDNNIDLCLKEKGIPIWVEAEEGIAIDPRDDPNPQTEMKVIPRW